jgi:2-amino-4-hydroxy-6-hydroxymethyldihydropteridine diphosphokinase
MITAYIGLGSNLGDRQGFIKRALELLAGTEGVQLSRASDIMETEPLGKADQPSYLNAVAELQTTLSPEQLHRRLIEIETLLGRERTEKWSSRIIDLDLLLYGDDIINSPDLTVPHRQMHLRSFVLQGLCQLNCGLMHPVMNETVGELAIRLAGADFVRNRNQAQLISVAGIIGVGKTTLAKNLSAALGCKLLLEPYDKNPFLPDVYAGKKELALDSQLYFLTARVRQLSRRTLPPGQIALADYVFDKEHIYARRLLNTQQLGLYEVIYRRFCGDVSPPVLVLYLRDSAERCLQRIRDRNRPYEQEIELPFLEALSYDYEQLFADWNVCPVIRIAMSEFNCRRKEDVERLAQQVRFYVSGTKERSTAAAVKQAQH